VSPHLSIHEGDVDGPPLLQRADLEPITGHLNPRPPTTYIQQYFFFLVRWPRYR